MTTFQRIDAGADLRAPRDERPQHGRQIFVDTLEAARRLDYFTDTGSPADDERRARNAFRMFARRHRLTIVGTRRRRLVSWREVEAELHRKDR